MKAAILSSSCEKIDTEIQQSADATDLNNPLAIHTLENAANLENSNSIVYDYDFLSYGYDFWALLEESHLTQQVQRTEQGQMDCNALADNRAHTENYKDKSFVSDGTMDANSLQTSIFDGVTNPVVDYSHPDLLYFQQVEEFEQNCLFASAAFVEELPQIGVYHQADVTFDFCVPDFNELILPCDENALFHEEFGGIEAGVPFQLIHYIPGMCHHIFCDASNLINGQNVNLASNESPRELLLFSKEMPLKEGYRPIKKRRLNP